jgi:C-terminal processing protease CtpA/Prc
MAGAALLVQDSRPALTRTQMEADLRQLAAETQREWAYAEDRKQNSGIDPAALAEALVARLGDVKDDSDFVGLVREFVAGLQDGHAYHTWSGVERRPFRRWPVIVHDVAEGLVVDSILPTWRGGPPAFARGDLVLEVNGRPVAEIIAEAERRTNASTDAARRKGALFPSFFVEPDPSEYRVRRLDGSEATVVASAAASLPEAKKRPRAQIEARRLDDGIAYVRIPTFALADSKAWANAAPEARPGLLQKDADAIRAAFAAAEGCRAVVLDLRGNGGGTDLLGKEVAACLLPQGSVYYSLSSLMEDGRWRKPIPSPLKVDGTPPRFTGQLLVLIDEGSFSATDNLCRCLDDLHPDVTFVGRPTGGGTGAPRPKVTLEHSGVVVGFCTMRVWGPKGGLIDGRGTPPDVPVRPTRDDVLSGRDPDLEAALRLVRPP